MLRFWRFLSLYLTAITLSLTFCHLLEMPQKMQYSAGLYLSVQQSLYLFFAWVGAFAEIGAVISLVVLCVMLRKQNTSLHLTLAAALCVAAGLAVWFAVVAPANTEMARWSALPLPATWPETRNQWEHGHAASAILDLIGFGVLIWSVIRETPRIASRGTAEDRFNS